MCRTLLSLMLAGLLLGVAGCGEKPKEPKTIGDVVKQGKETAKEAKKEVDKAVNDATK